MKKLFCTLLCLTFIFTTGCGLFKSDEEKYQELTTKFEQEFKVAPDKSEKQKLSKKYIENVPVKYKDKATAFSNNLFFLDGAQKYKNAKMGETSGAKLGHYSEK